MKTYLTADWHLGEDRMSIMGRPFASAKDMVEYLRIIHNAIVNPEDEVIVVGDVCYQKAPEWLEKVALFNGRKTLIRGNHDKVFTDEQLKPYFEHVIPDGMGLFREFGGLQCYVTHYPTEGRADMFNIVGHVHAAWKYQLNMFNVGVDTNHFRPVDIETVPKHFEAICKFYDKDVWVAYNDINAAYVSQRGKAGTYFRPTV